MRRNQQLIGSRNGKGHRSNKGDLYVFEGPDGVGKSTVAQLLVHSLEDAGRQARYFLFPGNVPGSLGRLIYDLHHDRSRFGINSIDPTSLQILHIAAHVDVIESQIKPLINAGTNVVLDRYWWSTEAYGKVLGADEITLGLLIELEMHHWKTIKPKAIFLLSRETPIGVVKDGAWERVQHMYDAIARRERKSNSIHNIENESTPADARRAVLSHIDLLSERLSLHDSSVKD